MLRRILFTSVSLLMIAIAYRVMVGNASAQAGSTIDAATVSFGYGAVVGRVLHYGDSSGQFYTYPYAIPGTSPVVAIGGQYNPPNAAMLANGDIYERDPSGPWRFIGNILGGATSTRVETW